MANNDTIANLRNISAQLITLKGAPLTDDECETVEEAIESLKKQIPQKLEYRGQFTRLCPVCHRLMETPDQMMVYEAPYCPECGQALDWSQCQGAI